MSETENRILKDILSDPTPADTVASPSPGLVSSDLVSPTKPKDGIVDRSAQNISAGNPGTSLDVPTPADNSRQASAKVTQTNVFESPIRGPETEKNSAVVGRNVEPVSKTQQQPADMIQPTAKVSTTDGNQGRVSLASSGDVQGRVTSPPASQIGVAVDQAAVKTSHVETRTAEGQRQVSDAIVGSGTVGAQNLEQKAPQFKHIGTPVELPQSTIDGSSARKPDNPGGGSNLAPQKSESLSPAVVQSTRATLESPTGVVSNPVGSKDSETLADAVPVVATSQFKADLPVAQQTRSEPVKSEPPKGSEVVSTQGAAIGGNRQDVLRTGDSKVDAGRPFEQAGLKDAIQGRDPKSVGVLNETFGQKTETGSRVEPTNALSAGNRTDASTAAQKADQITKGIEGRVNEGARQPSVAEGRVPGTSETTTAAGKQPGISDGSLTGVRQPGIESGGKTQGIADGAQAGVKQTGATDGAGVTGKQPSASEGSTSSVRQPLHEGGDKAPSSGSGGSGASESTRKIDGGTGAGSKAEGQSATGGMGGGSSAPTDRAPHKPFSVEDAQPTKGTTGDVRGDVTGARSGEGAGGKVGDAVGGKGGEIAGAKGGEAAGGKAGDVVGGKAGDIAGSKGTATGGAGPRFDTGEVRGTEPGARFDSGELKDGRSAGSQSGGLKGGDGSAVKGSDAGIVKGTDITGTKGATGGGQGIGGSSGSADSGLLGDKRQPSMLPDGMLNQGGKPGKVGDGVSGGGGIFGTDVPFVLPGALAGKEGGRRQVDQIFTDKGKADVAPVGKQDAVAAAGKSDTSAQTGRSDYGGPAGKGDSGGPAGKGETGGPGGRGESAGKGDSAGSGGSGGKGEAGGAAGKGEQPKDFKDKGQKADVGIPAAMAGQIGAGAAEVGGALKNFAQSVLSDGKSAGQAGEGAQISKDLKDAFKSPAAMDGSGKETPNVRQDYSGPGRKTQILPNEIQPGTTGVGPGGVPVDAAAKKSELGALGSALPGTGAEGIAAGGFADDAEGGVPLEEFNLPEVDLLSDADEVEEVEEIEEAVEAKIEDEMHYELALGLQLYTSIAGAQCGAYHYFSLNKEAPNMVCIRLKSA